MIIFFESHSIGWGNGTYIYQTILIAKGFNPFVNFGYSYNRLDVTVDGFYVFGLAIE